MKLYYRNSIFWNQLFFLILGFSYLYIVSNIGISQSPFNRSLLQDFSINYFYILSTACIFTSLLYLNKKVSAFFYMLYHGLVLVSGIWLTGLNFSKISLFLTSVYILLAYYFYQLLKNELQRASTVSRIDQNSLRSHILLKIPAMVRIDGEDYEGYFVNWDRQGACLKLDKSFNLTKLSIKVSASLKGYELDSSAFIVSCDKEVNLIGVDFVKEEKSILNWDNFFDTINKLGFKVEYLK